MTNGNDNVVGASKQSDREKVDATSLFNSLWAQRYFVWEVGRNHYLWINREIVNIEKIDEIHRALRVHGILKAHQVLTVEALQEFLKVSRMKSLSFENSVQWTKNQEEIKAYKKVKWSNPKSKEFFRSWVLKYVHPQSKI